MQNSTFRDSKHTSLRPDLMGGYLLVTHDAIHYGGIFDIGFSTLVMYLCLVMY